MGCTNRRGNHCGQIQSSTSRVVACKEINHNSTTAMVVCKSTFKEILLQNLNQSLKRKTGGIRQKTEVRYAGDIQLPYFNQTPRFEVCVDRCGSKNSHLEDMCSKEIGLCLQNTVTTLHSIVILIGGAYVFI